MNLLWHLLLGGGIGVIFAAALNSWIYMVPAVIGSVLPDMIDKTIWIVSGLGNGRFGFHSLLVIGILAALAGMLWFSDMQPLAIIVIALTVGIFSHQILDSMWLPRYIDEWVWPVGGGTLGNGIHENDLALWMERHPFGVGWFV